MTAKLGFRKWLILEDYKKTILEATERSDFPDRIFAYLSVASVPFKEDEQWKTTVFSLVESMNFQPNKKLPLIKDSPNKNERPVPWDYDGRTWAYWSHLISKAYGWTLEYIAELDVDEALARVQEILTDEQLDREFLYGLSEVAYPYNPSTKKSIFKPMSRPYWMKEVTQDLKKYKFPRSMLPMGAIEDVSGMPLEYNPLRDYVQKKTKTEKTNPPPSP